jgi:release factor glutamine methyltransferase
VRADEDLPSLLRAAAGELAAAGVGSPRVDAELLAAHVLGIDRGELQVRLARGDRLPGPALERWRRLVAARAARTPLQHLTGRAPFRRLDLAVGPGVFVPRPESELLVEAAVRELGDRPGLVVDLCTGSGAIALAVADEVATARVVALELEPSPLAWAARNRAEVVAGERVELREGDVRGAAGPRGVLADLVDRVDVVTANPPYIPPGAVPVEAEVADHDPPAALYGGGDDGLDVPRAVVEAAAALLRPGGLLLMEHADVQGPATHALADGGPWSRLRTLSDLAGRDRVLSARRR